MKLKNEAKQIKEVVRRLNYYEKGLQAGRKIKAVECKLCKLAGGCDQCLASGHCDWSSCSDGELARCSIASDDFEPYSKRIIRQWQAELKCRANENLKAAGSKWRIEWERV